MMALVQLPRGGDNVHRPGIVIQQLPPGGLPVYRQTLPS